MHSVPGSTSTRLSLTRHTDLSAQRLVQQPQSVRSVALWISLLMPMLSALMLILPWQQSATGVGRVIAWSPANRQQAVDAPIEGRLVQWMVQEGQRVREGDPLVELRDNDADWFARLEQQREAAGAGLTASLEKVRSYETKLSAELASKELVIAQYAAKIAGLERKRVGEQAELQVAMINEARVRTLLDEGISSTRKFELTELKRQKADAGVQARDQEISATRRAQGKASADADAKIASVRADLETARTKLSEVRQKRLELEGKVARQSTQLVTAPRDSIVLSVEGGPGGAQVKKGDRLLTLVPDTNDRAVELWVDGNDMPLIQEGESVRVLFEGWPALQFIGLPGGGTGTFAGLVSWVDAADDGKGRFRVVVVPDPDPTQGAWPDPDRLRQGVRAKGFVLLGQVSLGYELWRQINGFPPLPKLDKGSKPDLPTQKKPRAPSELR